MARQISVLFLVPTIKVPRVDGRNRRGYSVLRDGCYTLGEMVDAFEQAFNVKCESKYVVGLVNGFLISPDADRLLRLLRRLP